MERPERPSRTYPVVSLDDSDLPELRELRRRQAEASSERSYPRRQSGSSNGNPSNAFFIQLLDLRRHPSGNTVRRERNSSRDRPHSGRRYIPLRQDQDGPMRYVIKRSFRRRAMNDIPDETAPVMSPILRSTPLEEEFVEESMAGEPELNAPLNTSTPSSREDQGSSSQPTGQVDDVLRSILGVLECPVCFEYVTPPIPQCEEGHLLCGQCFGRLTVCPKCRAPFTDIRNRAVEKIADVIPYPCRNSSTGCSEMVLLRDKGRHEQSCGFRQFTCLDLSCLWRGYKPELLVHMTTLHPRATLLTKEQSILVSLLPNDQSSWLLFEFDEVFHVMFLMDARKKLLVGLIMCLGDAEVASKFIYTLSLEKSTEPFTKLSYSRMTHSEAPITSLLDQHHHIFSLPVDTLQSYLQQPLENSREVSIKVRLELRQPPE